MKPRSIYDSREPGAHVALYDGRAAIGNVIGRGREHIAYDVNNRLLGVYASHAEARRAVRDAQAARQARSA